MKHWKSIIALIILPFAFYFNLLEFYFAILFLIWAIQGVRAKTVNFLDDIYKNENPVLYWIVTIMWFALSLLALIYSEPFVKYLSS